MKALLLAAVLAQAADAPLIKLGEPLASDPPESVFEMSDEGGKSYVCMTQDAAIKTAGKVKGCEAFEAKVQENVLISRPLFVGVVVGTLLLGAAAGLAAGLAVK